MQWGITGPAGRVFLLASTIGLAEQLCLTGPAELVQLPQGPDVTRQSIPPAGARAEKALALVEASFMSLGPGTLSRF